MNRKQLKLKLNKARKHSGHSHRPLVKDLDGFKVILGLQVSFTKQYSPISGEGFVKGRIISDLDEDQYVCVYSGKFNGSGHYGDDFVHYNDSNCWWVPAYSVGVVNV